MKIDAHQHFWKYNEREYGWMSDEMDVLRRDFLLDDLAAVQDPIGFDGAVTVQARMTVEETEWLLSIAEKSPRIRGIVGWVDFCAENVREDLDRFADHPKAVGFRHVVHDEPDDEYMLRPDFLRGLGILNDYDLTYDLLTFTKHLPVAEKVVQQFPDLPFVLDHISKPFIKDGAVSPWDDDLRVLASYDNVTCKISGMVTEADWTNWKPEDFTPYMDIVLEAFGPNRLMIGSDWPVCTLAGQYGEVMQIVVDYVKKLSTDEQARILGGTCAEFYRLPEA